MNTSFTSLVSIRRVKRIYLLFIPLFILLFFVHFTYDGFSKVYDYHSQNKSSSLIFRISNSNANDVYRDTISSIFSYYTIYPKNYPKKLPLSSTDHRYIKFNGSPESVLTPQIMNSPYKNHKISVFSSFQPDKSDCDLIEYQKNLQITNYTILPDDFIKMAEVLEYQIQYESPFQELEKFFEGNKIPRILKKGHTRQHFYKFAGTSVWLENHGVHLMVSRVIFSQYADKNRPQLSLLYAQLYDENWKELVDIELVLQVFNADNERVYEKVKFPRFLPIPFYHNADKTERRWYGPEDTRLLLTKNQYGENEPIIIFNSYHRQIGKIEDIDVDSAVQTSFKFYRSMFVGWLFQYQKGKANVDEMSDLKSQNISYLKVKELRIHGRERQLIEKNWTPFIDPNERNIDYGGRDDYIYIIYQWNNLKVLKCELADFIKETHSNCQIYHIDIKDNKESVGPIRGGTELIPIKTNTERNLWIGFLRAHIDNCGCGGGAFYRPNFLVLERVNKVFKLTYLSGSITFDIPVYGFEDVETVCRGNDPNPLIPNGISMFDEKRDYLTLSLSVADQDNTMIHIRGAMALVESLSHTWDGEPNNEHISEQIGCVVKHAVETCRQYALKHYMIGDSEIAKMKVEQDKHAALIQANKLKVEKAEKERKAKEKAEQEQMAKEIADQEQMAKEMEDENPNAKAGEE